MNNKIVCVLQKNANILCKYIRYYRYKQRLSNVLEYVYTQSFVSVKVNQINTIWFIAEAALLRNSRGTYISKNPTIEYLKIPFTVIYLYFPYILYG